MSFLLYMQIGLIYSLIVFILAEINQGLFSEELRLQNLYEIITDLRVVIAFILITLFWPLALLMLVFNTLREI